MAPASGRPSPSTGTADARGGRNPGWWPARRDETSLVRGILGRLALSMTVRSGLVLTTPSPPKLLEDNVNSEDSRNLAKQVADQTDLRLLDFFHKTGFMEDVDN